MDPDDREIFREALTECDPNIDFLYPSDPMEALSTLNPFKNMPKVIFLENYIPRMNGIECLRALNLNTKTISLPTVIYLTSVDSEKEKSIYLQVLITFCKTLT
jgi:CheY-like chemotaxis protein